MLSDEEEILDLVDEKGQVVGSVTHAEAFNHANLRGYYLRAVNCFIVNSKGELWIPKRGPHKKIAPNGLDYSVGEHAQAGEPYVDAVVRGFAEELNMTVKPEDLVFVTMLQPASKGIPYIEAQYLYYSDQVPDYNPDDFVSYEWLTPEALLAKLHDGIPAKYMERNVQAVLSYMREHQRDYQRHE